MNDTVQLTFYEKMVLKGRSMKKWIGTIHSQGKTKVSLLLIPHNHENIVKIEFTVYLLTLLGAMSFFTIFLGFGYLGSYLWTRSERVVVFEKGRYQKSVFLHHYELATDLKDTVDSLNVSIDELNKVTWGKRSQDIQIDDPFTEPAQPGFASLFPVGDEMKSNMKIYKTTVEKFSEIHKNLTASRPYFLNAADYLETRESIVQSMPRGRPLGPGVGYIASTFGNREDPVKGGGEFHNGVDFATASRTPIYASAPGVIAETAYAENSLGNYVRINHENGFFTLYAHCSETLVKKGDKVKRGDLIALVGSTGKSTGPHLHYEVHIGLDPAYNPQEFINID